MKIAVNGEALEAQAATLAALLAELDYEPGVVATAVNETFCPREGPRALRVEGRRQGGSVEPQAGRVRHERAAWRAHAIPSPFTASPLNSRLLVGTSQYPSPAILAEALAASKSEIVTVSLRREAGGSRAGESFWGLIRDLGLRVLPNTAGCRSVKEAVTTAHMARELFNTNWIKLEVIGDDDLLRPTRSAWSRRRASSATTVSTCFPT